MQFSVQTNLLKRYEYLKIYTSGNTGVCCFPCLYENGQSVKCLVGFEPMKLLLHFYIQWFQKIDGILATHLNLPSSPQTVPPDLWVNVSRCATVFSIRYHSYNKSTSAFSARSRVAFDSDNMGKKKRTNRGNCPRETPANDYWICSVERRFFVLPNNGRIPHKSYVVFLSKYKRGTVFSIGYWPFIIGRIYLNYIMEDVTEHSDPPVIQADFQRVIIIIKNCNRVSL